MKYSNGVRPSASDDFLLANWLKTVRASYAELIESFSLRCEKRIPHLYPECHVSETVCPQKPFIYGGIKWFLFSGLSAIMR